MQAEWLAIIPIAAGAYVATNLDNLTLFAVLLTRYRDRRRQVIGGYLLAATLLLGAGYLLAQAATAIPVLYLGLLGFIPMSVGVIALLRLFREEPAREGAELERTRYAGTAMLATAGTQIGNGTDTVITFAALFADSNRLSDWLIVITIGAMAALFIVLGLVSVGHPALSRWIDRYAARVTPFILILVGGYILANTATDVLAG